MLVPPMSMARIDFTVSRSAAGLGLPRFASLALAAVCIEVSTCDDVISMTLRRAGIAGFGRRPASRKSSFDEIARGGFDTRRARCLVPRLQAIEGRQRLAHHLIHVVVLV